MAVAVQLVSESRIDLAAFAQATTAATGQNHTRATDAKRTVSQLAADVSILDDFAGNQSKLSHAVTFVGFLFGGLSDDIEQIVEGCRGMPHLHTWHLDGHIRCVLIAGSLDQWHKTTVEGCRSHSPARDAFNKVYQALCMKGFNRMFEGTKVSEHRDGTFMLERS